MLFHHDICAHSVNCSKLPASSIDAVRPAEATFIDWLLVNRTPDRNWPRAACPTFGLSQRWAFVSLFPPPRIPHMVKKNGTGREERRWLYSGVKKMWREFKLLYIADQTFGMKTIISHLMGVGEWGEMAIQLQFPPLFIKLFATYSPFLHSSATFCANTIKCNATRSGAVATVTAIA